MRKEMEETANEILKQSDFTERQVRDIIENRHGWAVAEQFDSILKGEDLEEQNSNALRYILEALGGVSGGEWEYWREIIEEYLNSLGEEPEDFSAYQ